MIVVVFGLGMAGDRQIAGIADIAVIARDREGKTLPLLTLMTLIGTRD